MLLKDITGSDHFLAKHKERFHNFVFFLELAVHGGGFVTIERSVATPTSISLRRSDTTIVDARKVPGDRWDHRDISLTAARQALDAYLNLKMVAPWDYRTGVSYFLRTQADYAEYFQIQKFMQGKDRSWKPYLAGILGLDHEAVARKYEIEDQISEKTAEREKRVQEIELQNQDRGELVTRIEISRDEIAQIDQRLDGFDFHDVELQINKHVVDAVEARVTDIGKDLYDLDVDIAQLESSIASGIKFDLKRIKQIYDESKILLPDAMVKSYEDLLQFNRNLTRERNKELRDRIKELRAERDTLEAEHRQQSGERQRLLSIVQQADTFKKYKALQKEQGERRGNLSFLEGQLSRVDAIADIDRTLRTLRGEKDKATTAVETSLEKGSPIQAAGDSLFQSLCQRDSRHQWSIHRQP